MSGYHESFQRLLTLGTAVAALVWLPFLLMMGAWFAAGLMAGIAGLSVAILRSGR